MKRILAALLLFLALALGIVLALARWQAGVALRERQAAALTGPQFEAFLADQRRLTSLDVWPAGRGTRDAGERLNRTLALDSRDRAESAPDEEAWWADPALAEQLRCAQAPESTRPRFLGCADQIALGDLSILAALLPYDTWDPAASGAWRRYLDSHPGVPLAAMPAPNYAPLLTLAKLRLLQGYKDGDLLSALREVRQLARLTWTSETLLGASVALSILATERVVYEDGVTQGLLQPSDWTPLSTEDSKATVRVLWTGQSLFSGLAPPDALPRLEAEVPAPVGLCHAANEAALNLRLLRFSLRSPVPGELDLTGWFGPLDGLVRGGRCRAGVEAAAWADPSRDLDVLEGVPWLSPRSSRLLRVLLQTPWIRQALTLRLAVSGESDLNRYDE